MWIAITIIGGPIAFLMFVWAIVTVIRVMRPEHAVPLQNDVHLKRRLRIRSGEPLMLRFEDIRDLERERRAVLPGESSCLYGDDLPMRTDWKADLELRRN